MIDIALTLDDLQHKNRKIAKVIGIDNLLALSDYSGGTVLQIPSKKELFKLKVYKAISEEFDGTNTRKLAVKYRVSKTTICNIIGKRLGECLVRQLENINVENDGIDVLQDKHKELARIIGMDNLLALSECFGGTPIYISKREEIMKRKVYRTAKEEYDKNNLSLNEVAKKYDISMTTLYNVVNGKMLIDGEPI